MNQLSTAFFVFVSDRNRTRVTTKDDNHVGA